MQSSILVNADTHTDTHTGTVGNLKSGDGSQNLCQTVRRRAAIRPHLPHMTMVAMRPLLTLTEKSGNASIAISHGKSGNASAPLCHTKWMHCCSSHARQEWTGVDELPMFSLSSWFNFMWNWKFPGRTTKNGENIDTLNSLDFIKGICMKFFFLVFDSRKLPCLNAQESKVAMLIMCRHVMLHVSYCVPERDVLLDM